MSKTCYIGVDVGLTGIKAAAFDGDGTQIGGVEDPTPRTVALAGRQEVDMDGVMHAVLHLLTELAEQVGSQGYDVAGLGVTGHGNGLYGVDESLRPVGPAFASSDLRAARYVAEISASQQAEVHAATGSGVWPGQPLPLLRWLRDKEPERYARLRWALCCKDWVVAGLTGAVSADYSDASACGLLDLTSRQPSPVPVQVLGLEAETVERFAPPRPSGSVVGGLLPAVATATGLPPDLPVIAGCMDCVASTLGTGAGRPGDLTVIVGTWAINAVVSATAPPPDVTLSALLPDPATMLCMEVSPTSASNLSWLAAAVGQPGSPVPVQTLLQEAAEVPAGSEGLIFLPFVNGSTADHPASGTFVGLSAFHRRGHLVRAVLEGVAQFHRVQLERVKDTGMVAPGRPGRLAGGGARSALWAQILADVTRLEFIRHRGRELGALGVAALVPEALGRSRPGWFEGEESDQVCPGPDSDVYRGQAAAFDEALTAMVPVWRTLADEEA